MSVGELWVYLGFFATLVAAGLGLPAPEELVITAAGVLAGGKPPPPDLAPQDVAALLAVNPHVPPGGGLPWAALVRAASANAGSTPDQFHVRWWILLPVCIFGVVCADCLLYFSGRHLGDHILRHRWLARLLPPDRRRRTEENFHRYGVSILVVGRLVPGIRAPLFLTAGSMRLPLPRFLLADGLGAVVGNSFFFFLGYWLGESVMKLIEHAEAQLRPILILVVIGLVGLYLLRLFVRHPVSTGDPSEVPIIGPQVASHIEQTEESSPTPPPSENGPPEKKPPRDNPPPAPSKRIRKLPPLLIVLGVSAVAAYMLWQLSRQSRG